jgi:hypothetical protein
MSKIKRPACYAAPLRSRKAIVAFLTEHTSYYRNLSTCSPLAWNVKDYRSDLSFDNLTKVWRESGEYGPDEVWLDSEDYLKAAREKYDEVKDDLWGWAIESARDHAKEDCGNRTLWDGTELQVEYGFYGRSGGWLLMTRFEGWNLTRYDRGDFEELLEDMPYGELRSLYQLVVQCDHDFRPEAVTAEIEHCAAFGFFVNICGDIPQPDALQLTLPLA